MFTSELGSFKGKGAYIVLGTASWSLTPVPGKPIIHRPCSSLGESSWWDIPRGNDLHRRFIHYAASIHLLIKPMLRRLFYCEDASNDCAADELEVDEAVALMKKTRLSST